MAVSFNLSLFEYLAAWDVQGKRPPLHSNTVIVSLVLQVASRRQVQRVALACAGRPGTENFSQWAS